MNMLGHAVRVPGIAGKKCGVPAPICTDESVRKVAAARWKGKIRRFPADRGSGASGSGDRPKARFFGLFRFARESPVGVARRFRAAQGESALFRRRGTARYGSAIDTACRPIRRPGPVSPAPRARRSRARLPARRRRSLRPSAPRCANESAIRLAPGWETALD
jgi:hypothetical protein